MEFNKPSEENHVSVSIFVRVADKIHVNGPNDCITKHSILASQDGILNEIDALKENDPTALDAGMVSVFSAIRKIKINFNSDTLGLPVPKYFDEAREATVETFKNKLPDFEIVTD